MSRVKAEECWPIIQVTDDPAIPSFRVLQIPIVLTSHRLHATLIAQFNDAFEGPGVLQDLVKRRKITEDDRGRLVLCLQGMNQNIAFVHPCTCAGGQITYRLLSFQSMVVVGERLEEIVAVPTLDDLAQAIEHAAAEGHLTEEVRDRVVTAVREGIHDARGRPPAEQAKVVVEHMLGAVTVMPPSVHNN